MKSKKLFILLSILSISFVTVSPTLSYAIESNNSENEKTQRAIMRTVTFDSDGGSAVAPVQVEHGFRVSEPTAPTKPGYIFKGWYKEGWSTSFGFKYETILADTKLVAKWEKIEATKHTVTFDSDGGSEVSPVQVEHAFLLPKPEDPIKAGYKFVGWYKEGWNIPFGFNYDTVMADMTLVAKWEKMEAVKHTVTFDSDGGSEVSPVEVEHAFLLPKPEDPIKAGYTFKGWYREGWNIPFGFAYDTVMEDITLVAKWEKTEVTKHTVTFDSDGGSAVSPVEVEHAFLLPKPSDPTKAGYTFKGWYREGWQIPFGFAYDTVMEDITLVAKWEKIEAIKHTVTFDSAGGTPIAPVEVEHGFRVQEPTPPTRVGYNFKGWNKEGWLIPFGFNYEMITSDITLVAQWEKSITTTHTVTFDSNGGTPVAPVEVEHGFLISEPTPPTKTGYKFLGWYKEDWQIPFGFSYDTILDDTTLIAKWEKIEDTKFTVTFDLGYGLNSYTQDVSANGLLAEPVAPTRVGYRFVGWYSDATLSQAFDFSIPVTSNVTLYAKWEKVSTPPVTTYLVQFNTNGGTAIPSQIVPINGLISKPTNPTMEGYYFVGWYSDASLSQTFDFSTPVTANVTLYAKWERVGTPPVTTYLVQFNTNGGTEISDQVIELNGKVTKPTDPAKIGYKFVGWFSDETLTQSYDFSTGVTGNTIIYAKWEKVGSTNTTTSINVSTSNKGSASTNKELPRTGESGSFVLGILGVCLLSMVVGFRRRKQ